MSEAPTEAVVDGRYRILGRIGSGGMADVYRAEDTHLARDVALKVLHRRFARDEQFVERFRREASSAAGLQHPHVVNVFDRGEHDGTYYIAMEHLEGRTLKEVIAEEAPLPQERAVDLGIQVLQAAAFAHKRGVIHRDFKPHNVIVDSAGDAKVTDFGIARAGASEITETGSILGTAQYLSPEQAEGAAVTAASDIYSIGVMLYELLAGRLPFEGDSAVAVAVKHLTEDPPRLSEVRPDVHPALEGAVMRALAKDPKERWGSADEFISVLQSARAQIALGDRGQGTAVWAPLPVADDAVSEEEVEGKERPWWRRRWLLLAIPLLLAAGLLAFLLLRGPAQVAVPDLVGEQLVDAQPQLVEAGFEVVVERETDPAPLNEVIDQEPPPGTEVDEGATVTLVASEGPGDARVPDVVGDPEQQAVRKLNRRDFVTETDRESSSEVEAGLVIRTVPAAGIERARGSTVQVIVSSGPRQVTVPDVIGESRDAAVARLDAQGFAVAVERADSNAPRNQVIDQQPRPGTRVDEGTQVTLTVSARPPRQPEEQGARVPNVVGLSAGAARAEIRAAGLGVQAQEQPTDAQDRDGVVLRQSPSGGTEVEEGSSVVIVVGRFEEPEEEEESDGGSTGAAPGTAAVTGRIRASGRPAWGAARA